MVITEEQEVPTFKNKLKLKLKFTPMFATQIARYGRITDFTTANFIWRKLMFEELPSYNKKDSRWDWESLNMEFKITYNLMLSLFRKVTDK